MDQPDQPRKTVELGFTLRLQDDILRCVPHLMAEDEEERQFWRRTVCRAVFGSMEAFLNVNRTYFILDMIRDRKHLMQTEEFKTYFVDIFGATESHQWELTENGRGKLRKRKQSFLPRLKAVVRMLMFLSEKA